MDWIHGKIETTGAGVEVVGAMLMDAGIGGIQIEDAADMAHFLRTAESKWDYVDESLLNETSQNAFVIFYVSANASGHETLLSVRNGLARLKTLDVGFPLGTLKLETENMDDKNWLEEWKKHYKPFGVGQNMVIVPLWEAYEPKPDEIIIKMNPGHAFGTGLHQTTRLCMAALEQLLKSKDAVLDLGCGTGILSVAAMKLGAAAATAVDIDPNAVAIALENAALNGVSAESFHVLTGNVLTDEPLRQTLAVKKANVVVANIVADVVVGLSPFVPAMLAPGGLFISSGIIDTRAGDVKEAFSQNGLTLVCEMEQDGWFCIVGRGPEGA